MAKMAAVLRGFRPVTTLIAMAVFVSFVSAGRYGDPTQTSELIIPLIFSGIILIGMLGLLCFFKRKKIKEKCCASSCCCGCMDPSPAGNEMMSTMKMTTGENYETNHCPCKEPDLKVRKNTRCKQYGDQDPQQDGHQVQNGCKPNELEVGHCSCPGCGAKVEDGRDQASSANLSDTVTRGRAKRLWDILRSKNTASNSEPKKLPDISGVGNLDNCFPMIQKRKALQQQDITHVGLMLEASESCHI